MNHVSHDDSSVKTDTWVPTPMPPCLPVAAVAAMWWLLVFPGGGVPAEGPKSGMMEAARCGRARSRRRAVTPLRYSPGAPHVPSAANATVASTPATAFPSGRDVWPRIATPRGRGRSCGQETDASCVYVSAPSLLRRPYKGRDGPRLRLELQGVGDPGSATGHPARLHRSAHPPASGQGRGLRCPPRRAQDAGAALRPAATQRGHAQGHAPVLHFHRLGGVRSDRLHIRSAQGAPRRPREAPPGTGDPELPAGQRAGEAHWRLMTVAPVDFPNCFKEGHSDDRVGALYAIYAERWRGVRDLALLKLLDGYFLAPLVVYCRLHLRASSLFLRVTSVKADDVSEEMFALLANALGACGYVPVRGPLVVVTNSCAFAATTAGPSAGLTWCVLHGAVPARGCRTRRQRSWC
eukprot:scaffold3210_cov402-Prasinococcus_capsulatus_cf.AAC.13